MVIDYPTISEPATAEYVLEVLRDMHRHVSNSESSANARIILTFDTTINQWQEAMGDWMPWRDLADAINHFWNIRLAYDLWHDVVEPGSKKRLLELCEFIAKHICQPKIRPAQFLGSSCSTAGAFLTIRSILQRAGADASLIAPSTPLQPYTRLYYPQLLQHISHLAPGVLPEVKIHNHPFLNITAWGILIGALFLLIGNFFSVIGACILVICFPLNQLGYPRFLPTSVEFGELKTFRDLAEVISKGAPKLRSRSA